MRRQRRCRSWAVFCVACSGVPAALIAAALTPDAVQAASPPGVPAASVGSVRRVQGEPPRMDGRLDEDGGWTAEFAIPLSAMAASAVAADGSLPAWRVNAQRYTASSGERASLFGADADRPVASLPDAGPLVGIVADAAGWGLRLRPGLRLLGERPG